MLKIIWIVVILLLILILSTMLSDRIVLFKKIKSKLNDYFNVRKYRRLANTHENDANTVRKDYVVALETIQTLVIQNIELQKENQKIKNERKELKRVIAEDMVPRKRKKKDDKKVC